LFLHLPVENTGRLKKQTFHAGIPAIRILPFIHLISSSPEIMLFGTAKTPSSIRKND